jgi:DNA-binding NtrC family response regulator
MRKSELGILVVDDEMIVRESLTKWFREDGFRAESAQDASEALLKIQNEVWNLVLVDVRMPGMDGIELLRRIKQMDQSTIVIIITAYAAVDSAVNALKLGAYDYITKPIDPDYLSHIVVNALEQQLLTIENRRLRVAMDTMAQTVEIVGGCSEIGAVIEQIATAAQTDVPVLVTGESGTGKELVARAIHYGSGRRTSPFVTVGCVGADGEMLESELFGTAGRIAKGALGGMKGKLELAEGGTIFIDEIEAMDLKTQADLLRAIDTLQFTASGGSRDIAFKVRLVCSTREDLKKAVHEGRFREDLFFRINVIHVLLPPLRARRGDVTKLAHFFAAKFARAMNRRVHGFTPEAMIALKAYDWPGNVRELENVIERAMVLSSGGPSIGKEHLVLNTRFASPTDGKRLEDVERRHIGDVLHETGWNVSRSASILDIDRVTLYHKIKKYGLKREN